MRQLSWLNISMVEIRHNRIDVRRERVGLDCEGVRGATVHPKNVEEAVAKLQHDEERARRLRQAHLDGSAGTPPVQAETAVNPSKISSMQTSEAPAYSLGRLVHRAEPELKTHTSYLVFALLPRDWTEEDEQKCRQQWPSDKVDVKENVTGKSRRQMKREAKAHCQEGEGNDKGEPMKVEAENVES